MPIKFTEKVLSQLRVPDDRREYQWLDADLPGFGLRKSKTGRGAYFIRYETGQRIQRKLTLGPYTPGVLTQMRKRASEILTEVRLGIDVSAEIRKGTGNHSAPTLQEITELYLEARRNEISPGWHSELTFYLTRVWAPFHPRALESLERGELVKHLDRVATEQGAVTADHTRRTLSTLFGWAIDRGYAAANPVMRLKRYAKGNGRDRALSVRELVAVWKGRTNDDFGRIVGLLIQTMQRKEEVSDLVWNEIVVGDEHSIKLPKSRTKNGLAHAVPLNELAVSIIVDTPRRQGRDFLFGEGEKGFQGWTKAKARLDVQACRLLAPDLMSKYEKAAGDLTQVRNRQDADGFAAAFGHESWRSLLQSILPHWTLHDLRRTSATLISEFGLAEPHVIEAILNHISGTSKGGVAGIYNRAQYEDQKRWALDRWGQFVASAVKAYDAGSFEALDAFERQEKKKLRGYPQKSAGSAGSAGIDR